MIDQRRIGSIVLALVGAAGAMWPTDAWAARGRVPAERLYFDALRLLDEGKEAKALELLLAVPIAPEVDLAHGSYSDIAQRRELIQLLINEGLSGIDPGFKIDKFGPALRARALTRVAEIYLRQKRYQEAADAAERAQLAEPDYPMAYCRAAQAFEEMGELPRAIKEAKEAYLKSPTYDEYRRVYASVIARDAARLHGQGETGKARLAFEFALQIDPLNPETLCRYGWLLFTGQELPFELDDGAEAKEAMRRYGKFDGLYMMVQATKLAPDVAAYHLQLGTAYEALGRTEDAARSYERAAQLDPQDPRPLLAAGRVFLALNAYDSAVAQLEAAALLAPEDAEIHASLAEAYRRKGLLNKAAEEARRAIKLDEENPRGHYELAMARLQRGQWAQAREPLERALSLDPNGDIGLRAKVQLLQLNADERK